MTNYKHVKMMSQDTLEELTSNLCEFYEGKLSVFSLG